MATRWRTCSGRWRSTRSTRRRRTRCGGCSGWGRGEGGARGRPPGKAKTRNGRNSRKDTETERTRDHGGEPGFGRRGFRIEDLLVDPPFGEGTSVVTREVEGAASLSVRPRSVE